MPTGHASTLVPTLRRVVLAREAADRPDADLVAAFTRDRDADAFAELVRRHGPMVLGLCRRVVGDHHTAEDAFQATFLVLARRAAAVRPRSAVGSWLYGVAYRTAVKARAVLSRRRAREKQVDTMPEPHASPAPEDAWSDVRPVIDEELARLPERLRLPVVLCDLEGRPQRQVAKHLGVPQQTLASRLSSARRLLAGRLTRRGVALSGGALATVLTGNASAAVSPRLADGLARAAEAVSAGAPVSSLVSVQAIHLCEGVMRMMLLAKLRAVGAAALATVALTTGLGLGLVPAHGADPKPDEGQKSTAAKPTPAPAAPVDDATFFRRVCLDLRGTPPSLVEFAYFNDDRDANKRRKVVDWLLIDEAVKAFLAKKLGIPAERIQSITLSEGVTVWVNGSVSLEGAGAIALNPDGKFVAEAILSPINSDAGVPASIILNERNFDLALRLPVTSGVRLSRLALAFDADSGQAQVTPLKLAISRVDPPPTLFSIIDQDDEEIAVLLRDEAQPAEAIKAIKLRLQAEAVVGESDVEFLRKVIQSARGAAPSAVEEKYFTEDKDPKKREKLLDLLLKDPAIAKKLGDDWKKKMLQPQPDALTIVARERVATKYQERLSLLHLRTEQTRRSYRLEKLVGELVGAKKTDEQVLDGLTLAVLGRLPTESEKLTLAAVGKAADKKAAWVEVAKALSATEEAKKHAAELQKANPPKPPEKK
jgi:RNA polymerase sigma factor (sigma-70 family)